VSLAFIYNLDVKTLNKMNAELAARKAAASANESVEEEIVKATAPETMQEDVAKAADIVDETKSE
jgi:hypothetical protein